MRTLARATVAALAATLVSSAGASLVTLTSSELQSSPLVSFPTFQPTVSGTSLTFAWGTSHGPPLMSLVRYRVNSNGSLPSSGDVTISAVWNVTRLECSGFCATGDDGLTRSDWDPRFYLSDGATMVGFGLGDSNGGTLTAIADRDQGAYGTDASQYWREDGTGYPAINGDLAVTLDFTLHDIGLTARIRYLGIDRTRTFTETLARSPALALLLSQDNDSGERYRLNYLQTQDAGLLVEPGTLLLVALAPCGLAIRHWTRQRPKVD